MNFWYIFVANQIASKEWKVAYCPTGEMITAYFTKPLGGSLLKKFQDYIMNGDPSSTITESLDDRRSVLEQGTSPKPEERLDGQMWKVVGHGRDCPSQA